VYTGSVIENLTQAHTKPNGPTFLIYCVQYNFPHVGASVGNDPLQLSYVGDFRGTQTLRNQIHNFLRHFVRFLQSVGFYKENGLYYTLLCL